MLLTIVTSLGHRRNSRSKRPANAGTYRDRLTRLPARSRYGSVGRSERQTENLVPLKPALRPLLTDSAGAGKPEVSNFAS